MMPGSFAVTIVVWKIHLILLEESIPTRTPGWTILNVANGNNCELTETRKKNGMYFASSTKSFSAFSPKQVKDHFFMMLMHSRNWNRILNFGIWKWDDNFQRMSNNFNFISYQILIVLHRNSRHLMNSLNSLMRVLNRFRGLPSAGQCQCHHNSQFAASWCQKHTDERSAVFKLNFELSLSMKKQYDTTIVMRWKAKWGRITAIRCKHLARACFTRYEW